MNGFLPYPPPVSLSSAVSHLCGCWRFRSLPWRLKPPGVPFHDWWRLQWRGCTVTPSRSRGLWPWTGPAASAGLPYRPLMPVPEEPQTLTASWALWCPWGSTWYTTEKRKTKINHTSKDGVHQFGEKEKWPKPWLIIGIYWLRALHDLGKLASDPCHISL